MAWAVVASSASLAGAAHADEPAAPARVGPRVVTLSVNGCAEDAELYAFTIRELLGRIDVRVSNGADVEGARVVAHVRVDATAPGGVAVFNLHFRSGYAEHAAAIAEVFPRRYMIKVEGSSQRHILALADDGPGPSTEALAERAGILDADGRFGVDFAALVGEMAILDGDG